MKILTILLVFIVISCRNQDEKKELKSDKNKLTNSCNELPNKLVNQPLGMLSYKFHLGDSLKTMIDSNVVGRLDPMFCDINGLDNCKEYSCYLWIPKSIKIESGYVTPHFSYIFLEKRLIRASISLTYDGTGSSEDAAIELKNIYINRFKTDSIFNECYSTYELDTTSTFYNLTNEIGYKGY